MFGNMPAPPLKQERKPRYGTIKVKIDSNHIIKGPDGVNRQYKVKDISRHPGVKTACICLKCGKAWPTESEMKADHADEQILVRQSEAHIYGWWSEDPAEPTADKKPKDLAKVIGLLSDEY